MSALWERLCRLADPLKVTRSLPTADFSSARQLVRWAREDIKQFDTVCQGFLGSNKSHSVFTDVDLDAGRMDLKLRVAPVPDELRKLASHALWDIKHALDHAMYAAAYAVLGRDPGDLHFLTGTSLNNLRSRLYGPKSKYPPELRPLIESFEHYATGDSYSGGDDGICKLSKLANNSKHAVALATNPRSFVRRLSGTGKVGGARMFLQGFETSEDELTLGTFPYDPDAKFNLELAGFVSFSKVELFKDTPAGEVLEAYATLADSVIEQLEAEVATIEMNRGGVPLHRVPPWWGSS